METTYPKYNNFCDNQKHQTVSSPQSKMKKHRAQSCSLKDTDAKINHMTKANLHELS